MDLPDTEKPQIDIRELSPLALAFVGDGVYELLVRSRLVRTSRLAPGRLHAAAVEYVSAKGQFAALAAIAPLLTEAEQAVVLRGRNASKASVAKHASPEEYRAATALECLFGWLHLRGEAGRIDELFAAICEAKEAAGPAAGA